MLHLIGLAGAAHFWRTLGVPHLAPQSYAVEVVAVAPEPEPPTTPEPIVSPPLLESPPLATADPVPIAPPAPAVPPPKRAKPRARPVPPPPVVEETNPLSPASDRPPGSVAAASTPTEQALPAGPPLPPSIDRLEATEGNALGSKSQETPSTPIEGGAAGAGNLFAQGDVPVLPGSGSDGGSGGPGKAGLGFAKQAGARHRGEHPARLGWCSTRRRGC